MQTTKKSKLKLKIIPTAYKGLHITPIETYAQLGCERNIPGIQHALQRKKLTTSGFFFPMTKYKKRRFNRSFKIIKKDQSVCVAFGRVFPKHALIPSSQIPRLVRDKMQIKDTHCSQFRPIGPDNRDICRRRVLYRCSARSCTGTDRPCMLQKTKMLNKKNKPLNYIELAKGVSETPSNTYSRCSLPEK